LHNTRGYKKSRCFATTGFVLEIMTEK